MKKIYFFILFLTLFNDSKAQIWSDDVCGADFFGNFGNFFNTQKQDNQALYRFMDSLQQAGTGDKILYRIPIKFWIYRQSDGTGGPDAQTIKNLIVSINYYHRINKTGLSFYLKPDISYINSSRHIRFGYLFEAPVEIFKHGEKGCVNIFVVRSLDQYFFGKTIRHFNGTYNSLAGDIILRETAAITTMSHEVGHYLGLKHPHKNWKRGKLKQESVSRSRKVNGLFRKGLNCENNGDKLCDTPAEPNLSRFCDKDCHFTGSLHDNWGDAYQSKTDNIMSYTYTRECRDKFTEGQKAVMLKTIGNKKYEKAWSSDNENAELYEFDVYEPDNEKGMASELLFETPQYHTFHRTFNSFSKKDADADADWFYFDLKNTGKQSVTLKISKSIQKQASMVIQVFDEFSEIKKQNSIPTIDDKGLILENLSKGRYFVCVSKQSSANFLSGYKITLSK
jgi:hypothetical protein